MSAIDRTDGLVGNAAIKYPCRMASTTNLVLSGLQTVDGIVGAQDDRIGVFGQTTGSQNGIYVMDSGTWERAQDADNDGAFTEGSLVKVNNGSANAGFWYVSNTGTITIDSTAITFVQTSSVLGYISAAWQAVVNKATIALGLTQAGFSAFVQTLLAAATSLAFRQTLLLDMHGADIASAATVNLDNATGDLVDVTGTVSITAITLAEGVEKTVRFTGALTLTNGASLVLPGGANITTAAGDFAIFRGYAAGVVRCISYQAAANAPYSESTFTATLTGCTTAPTYTVKCTKIGNQVNITCTPAVPATGTSNAITKTLTGMPAAFRPAGTIYGGVTYGQDGGGDTSCHWTITSAGVIRMGNGFTAAGVGNWTNSGTFAGYMPPMTYNVTG